MGLIRLKKRKMYSRQAGAKYSPQRGRPPYWSPGSARRTRAPRAWACAPSSLSTPSPPTSISGAPGEELSIYELLLHPRQFHRCSLTVGTRHDYHQRPHQSPPQQRFHHLTIKIQPVDDVGEEVVVPQPVVDVHLGRKHNSTIAKREKNHFWWTLLTCPSTKSYHHWNPFIF